MSEEFVEISPDDGTIEIIEEDYIIEDIDESIYTVDIKEEEEDVQPDDGDSFSEREEYGQIVYLGKEDGTDVDVYHCALCNITFASIEQHLKENHSGSDVEQYDSNIQMIVEEETEEELGDLEELNQQDLVDGGLAHAIKIETTDISCKTCGIIFDTVQDVESHECEGFNLTRTIICCKCQDQFENDADMDTHLCQPKSREHEHLDIMFSCPGCPRKFALITDLQEHQKCHKLKKNQAKKDKRISGVDKTDHSEKIHCEICNTTFSCSKNLKLHAKMHLTIPTKTIKDAMPIGADEPSDKNQFYCEICNKSFDHALLSVHQNMHQNVEEHNCSICNRQFENQVSYDMHMQLHADQPTRVRSQKVAKPGARFACNYCGIEFLRPHEKVKHERIHTGEKPHECEVCGKCFRVSYSLTLHLRTHTDVRPFVCAQCNKRFKAYAVYSHHLNTHSEDRPYKCPMCPKSFRTSVQLCGHKNSHTKPYNCPECNRPFASLYAVKMHMKTHNKANKSNENLKHRCGICGAVYARMFALRFHIKEQHSADLTEEQQKDLNDDKKPPITADDCFNEDEVSTQAILQEETIIDNFHTEEIVTDWLTQK